MPFTFSHPAIVLPFNRVKGLSITGMIAGSVSPDFEYFIRMSDKRIYTHTWSGLLWFDVPLALLLAYIFHNLIRNHIIQNAPVFFQLRLRYFEYFQWNTYFKKYWISITFSTVFGIASHLLWDGFTHENGIFVQAIPLLASTISISGILVEVHMILQVLSSILGGVVIFYAIWQLPIDNKSPINRKPLRFWLISCCIATIIYLIRLLFGVSYEIEDFIIPAISSVLFGIIITCILIEKHLVKLKAG
jgi:hypothetical protein